MTRQLFKGMGVFLLAGTLALAGCSGSDGDPGRDGTNGTDGTDGTNGTNGTNGQDLTATAKPESCAVCHPSAGSSHQAIYNQYTDASTLALTIEGIKSTDDGAGTFNSTITVLITKNGQPYVDDKLAGLEQKRFYAFDYDASTRKFLNSIRYNEANVVSLGSGRYSITATKAPFAPESSNAQAYAYVADEKLPSEGMELYNDVASAAMKFSTAVDAYASTANVAGCEKCHGKPYLKHGYRAAQVPGLPDFAACKACHTDESAGGHQDWQFLVDEPAAFASAPRDAKGAVIYTAEQLAKYAYKKSVMNDVHMSHAMEFAYPQSMANCATCHEGKLDQILTNANFKLATCKSCHPVTGTGGTDPKRAPALSSLVPANHVAFEAYADSCSTCHQGAFKPFNSLHTGYDKKIYADNAGTKYSAAIKVKIDSASLSGNVLNVKFSAAESPDVAGLDVANIKPMVLIGLYGYDTKDFIVSAHGKDAAGNRNLEWTVGTTHPRFTTVSAANGAWEITADLSDWASLVADGTVKRAEIAVLPELKDAAGVTLALDAPSKTFDLAQNQFADGFYKAIVKVDGCNKCHDALATTFHSANRGGNVVVCRICHTTREGGGHLEMQSRSIDSYVHSIHSFQAFDIGSVNFADPVASMRYKHHIESTYPNFTILNCESCHNAGTYEVPDQSKSLPGVHSAAAAVTTMTNWPSMTPVDRAIGAVPSYVTGPASRACGSCHRAELINEDKAGELAAFNAHTGTFGYLLETSNGVLDAAIAKIMAVFK